MEIEIVLKGQTVWQGDIGGSFDKRIQAIRGRSRGRGQSKLDKISEGARRVRKLERLAANRDHYVLVRFWISLQTVSREGIRLLRRGIQRLRIDHPQGMPA